MTRFVTSEKIISFYKYLNKNFIKIKKIININNKIIFNIFINSFNKIIYLLAKVFIIFNIIL